MPLSTQEALQIVIDLADQNVIHEIDDPQEHKRQETAIGIMRAVFIAPAKNTIVKIGYLGVRTCYLNISKEEAIERYMRDNDEKERPHDSIIDVVEVTDEWFSYD